jgi:hypothetical protein
MSDGLELTPPDPDSEGCLCVVASYVNAAPLVERVTAEAAKRIMMSPATGDFIELRFADLGPQPGMGGDRSRALQRVTDEMMSPHVLSGRNYFALVVIDRSAAAAEEVLSGCAAAPFLAALRMRFLGIASSDDRRSGDRGPAPGSGPFPNIVTSPSGAWRRENDLVDVLRHYGDELLRYFATRHEPGLGLDELAELSARYEQFSAQEAATKTPASATVKRDAGPAPDLLEAGAVAVRKRQPPDGPRQEEGEPEDRRPRTWQANEGNQAPGEELASGAQEPPGDEGPARRPSRFRSRWLPEVRWRRGNQEEAGDVLSGKPDTRALVYLLIIGDDASGDHAAWNHSRAVLLEVDKKIAATPGVACQVRALQGDEHALCGELREAGRLSRRNVKRPVADVDFAAVLERIRAMLQKDRTLAEASGAAAVRAAVVFFAPDPPLADTATADVFAVLAREASVVWVVPKESVGLVAPALRETPGVRVLTDYEAVAAEVVDHLGGYADVTEAAAGPTPSRAGA